MSRPHTEFIQSQDLAWAKDEPGVGYGAEHKVLSRDDADGAITVLVRLPAGWRGGDFALGAEEEVFVLDGALTLSDRTLSTHDYVFSPAGTPRRDAASEGGAVLLCFFDGPPSHEKPQMGLQPLYVRTTALPWDRSNMDPNINHLHAARKNLRIAPDGSRRTYLLGGMPHGFPPEDLARRERHPHVEEFFMVSGQMACSMVGVMRTGAYFWRPPLIWHGLDSSLEGFLLFCRTPGAAATVSEWSPDAQSIDRDPLYRPVLAPDLAQLSPAGPQGRVY